MRTIIDAIGGRKVIMSLVILAAGTAIDLVTPRGLSENLMYLMLAIAGFYSTANVVAKKFGEDVTEAPPQELSQQVQYLEQFSSGVTAQVAALQEQVSANNKRLSALMDVVVNGNRGA